MLHQPDPKTLSGPPAYFAWRVTLLYCAPMMVNGIALLYLPAYLKDLGMTDVEIGIIVSLPFLLRMIGMPIGTALADRVSDRAVVIIWSAVVSLVSAVLMFFAHSFWPVILFYSVQSLVYAPFVPIAESILVSGVRRWGFDYGVLRMWPSVAFVVATLLGGVLLDVYGGAMVLPAMALFFVFMLFVAIACPRLGRHEPVARSEALGAAAGKNPFWRPDFLLVITGAALVQGSHGLLFGFATNYWTAVGISGIEVSLLWTSGVVAEIVLFLVSGRYLTRFGHLQLVLFGCLVAVLRWTLFPLVADFWSYLALQATHAFTFAIIHVGIQRFLMDRIGDERGASAQGFYQFFISVFTVAVSLASGFIFQSYGVKGFYVMTLIAAVGVGCVIAAMRLQPHRVRSGG